MRNRFFLAFIIVAGTISGWIGDYSASNMSDTKLLPATYAFSIWIAIYAGGGYLVWLLLTDRIDSHLLGVDLLALGYGLSGLWIRFDGHSPIMAPIVLSTAIVLCISAVQLQRSNGPEIITQLGSVFAGWISGASSLVIADVLDISRASDEVIAAYLAVVVLIIAGVAYFYVKSPAYAAVLAWALVAIAFGYEVSGTFITAIAALGAVIAIALSFVLRRRIDTNQGWLNSSSIK